MGPRVDGGRPRRSAGDRGQATLELALVLPVLATVALLLVQVGLIVRCQVLVTHAAREAARAASVDGASGAARDAAGDASPLDPRRLEVAVEGDGTSGSRVRVEVRYRAPTEVPMVGALVGDVLLVASATMRVE